MAHQADTSAQQTPMTLNEAIMLGFFIQQCSKALSCKLIDKEGYFYVAMKTRIELAPVSLKRQRIAIASLIEQGYLSIKKSYSSPRRYYKVYVDSLLQDIQPSWFE